MKHLKKFEELGYSNRPLEYDTDSELDKEVNSLPKDETDEMDAEEELPINDAIEINSVEELETELQRIMEIVYNDIEKGTFEFAKLAYKNPFIKNNSQYAKIYWNYIRLWHNEIGKTKDPELRDKIQKLVWSFVPVSKRPSYLK